MVDIILEKGTVVDGTGAAATTADVGIAAGVIVAIGDLKDCPATRRLDVSGRVVTPGFIDMHTHCGFDPKHLTGGVNLNYLQQGVTTVVGGNCGFSPVDFEQANADVDAALDGPNLAMLVGHNSLRLHVMGQAARTPSDDELDAMQRLATAAMQQGASGLSSGPFYVPGTYADADELIAIAQAVATYGGLYATHIRSESDGLIASMEEAIAVGRDTGLPVQVSHHKAQGPANWGLSEHTLGMVDDARNEGIDVALDQYPYTASCSRLGTLMPRWVCAGSDEEAKARLSDPATRRRIRDAIVEEFKTLYRGELERLQIASSVVDPSLAGMTFADIAARRCTDNPYEDMAEFVMDLAKDHPASADTMCTSHLMCEEDLQRILVHPHTAIASDGWGVCLNAGHPHPRLYGTFPRILGRYCRDKGLLTLEEAVRKMTSMPASRLGLQGRGVLAVGAAADITVFDPAAVADRATFENPHQYPVGINYVLVNGQIVLDHGDHTGTLPGVFLRRK